eukprot:COSAG01_NODE_2206_length_8170_cov_70.537108_1_plen_487_part_00
MSVNSYLIECSHESAIIKDSKYNTYFTNRVGDGIQLNVNDKVSVQSAYIHEIGSGSQSIEFDGNTVSQETVQYTDTKGTYPEQQQFTVTEPTGTNKKEIKIIVGTLSDLPVWYNSHIYTTDASGSTPASIPKASNVMVTASVFSSLNGSLYQTLTISANVGNDLLADQLVYIDNTPWISHYPDMYTISSNKSFSYDMADNKTNISYSYYKNADGNNCMMLPRLYFAATKFPATTFRRIDKDGKATDDGVPANFLDFVNTPQDSSPYLELYRRKHDNSRYKIYTLVDPNPSIIGTVQASARPELNLASQTVELAPGRDIALRDFIPYYDILEMSIPSGYNTPANIAQDLTSHLHKSTNLQTVRKTIPNQADTKSTDIILSVIIPSPTFKQFTCSCVSSYNQTTYTDNVNTTITDDKTYEPVRSYLSSYTNIGVYDPNLFEAGRKLKRDGYLIRKAIAEADRATARIVLSMEYTEENLLLWKALFEGW